MENSVSFSRVNHKSSFIGIHCESENYGFGISRKDIQRFQTAYDQSTEGSHTQGHQNKTGQGTMVRASAMSVSSDKTSQSHSYDDWDQDNPERTWDPEQEKHDREEYARKNPEEMEERRLDRIEKNLRTGSKIGRVVGLDDAADHLDQFLDGEGSDRTMNRDEARKDPFIRRAEERNRGRFEDQTFTGNTDNSDFNRKLRSLKDGESIDVDDYWDTKQSDRESIRENARSGGPNNYLKYGRQKLTSKSKIRATRRGNKIYFEGDVEHNGDDDYDFHEGRVGEYTGAKDLQDAGRGKPFKTRRRWKQKVHGSVDIDGWKEGEGHVLKRPKAKWDDFE